MPLGVWGGSLLAAFRRIWIRHLMLDPPPPLHQMVAVDGVVVDPTLCIPQAQMVAVDGGEGILNLDAR